MTQSSDDLGALKRRRDELDKSIAALSVERAKVEAIIHRMWREEREEKDRRVKERALETGLYDVTPGDCLSVIAERLYNERWVEALRQIVEMNEIKDTSFIMTGQVLRVPKGATKWLNALR